MYALILSLAGWPLIAPSAAHAQVTTPEEPGELYAPGQILVGWDLAAPPAAKPAALTSANQAAAQLQAATGLVVLAAYPEDGFARAAVSPGQELSQSQRVAALPGIRFAEPNYTVGLFEGGLPPAPIGDPTREPYYSSQWNLPITGTPDAWAKTRGRRAVVVAVIDTGIDYAHPEFRGRIVAGVDYVHGGYSPVDDEGHGTFVASIIGAAVNRQGITGMAPAVSIMPLKTLDSDGWGWVDDSARAIRWAVDHGARVINMSLGGVTQSSVAMEAIAYATEHGVLIVASAGNCAKSVTSKICFGQLNSNIYPAAYWDVLAVGATDREDRWAGYSNYKPWVDLTAPGGTSNDPLFGALLGGGYRRTWGTSVSVPMVSGAAALILSLAPETSREALLELLTSTADKVDAYPYFDGRNDYLGYGRLNVGRAIAEVGRGAPGGRIEGRLWVDENGNGLLEEGEPAVGGHEVCAESLGGPITVCARSAGDGSYRITASPADYTVTADPAAPAGRTGNWSFRLPVSVWANEVTVDVNLGFSPTAGAPGRGDQPGTFDGQFVDPLDAVIKP